MSQKLWKRTPSRRSSGLRRHASVAELPIWPEKVQGGRLVAMLQRHIKQLRGDRAHGNRALFLDDVFVVYLLAFFNPTLRTLRTLEDFSQTKQAQRHLSIRRICRSTLSDFNQLADPGQLHPLIRELRKELARQQRGNRTPKDLMQLLNQIVAVDGTFLSAAADVAWAVASRNQRQGQCYRARTDWHVDVKTWIPELVVIPAPGESEADSAARTITPGTIHVYDRGFQSFALMGAHYEENQGAWTPRADFVLRLREPGPNSPTVIIEDKRPLRERTCQSEILSDQEVLLPGLYASQGFNPRLRLVTLRSPDGNEVRLLTTLQDVPAEVISLIYRYRWQIELFFRWLKCYANFDHLISHSNEGLLLNFYVVTIGAMLMYLHANGRPNKYLFSLLGLVAQGTASLDEIMPILRERERQCALDRASAARRRARKKAESL
jgi:hypothetical protein